MRRREFIAGATATLVGANMLHFTGHLMPQAGAQSTVPWSARFEIDRTNGTLVGWISDELPDPNTNPVPGVSWQVDALTLTETSPGDYTVAGSLTDPDGGTWDIVNGTATERSSTPVYVDLVVPAGETLTVDGPVEFHGRTVVAGTLELLPGADVLLVCDEAAYIGGDDGMGADPGLHIMGGGIITAAGTERARWTRLAFGEAEGNQTITVLDATGWQLGDELVICPTVDRDYGTFWDAYSTARIAAVNGNTIDLDIPLQHPHPLRTLDGATYTAEVLNVTSDITIRSDNGTRGHIMFHHGAVPQTLSNVALDGLGPAVLGRYPLHFHRAGDMHGSTITSVAVVRSGNRGFVPHESNGITFERCIAHDVADGPFWWDDREESNDITYRECVGSKVRVGFSQRPHRLSVFRLGDGVGNTAVDCVAVGNAVNGSAPSGFEWPEKNNNQTGLWVADRNVAHNCRRAGNFVWQNTAHHHVINDTVAYSCGGAAVDHGAYNNQYHWHGLVADDCGAAIVAHAKTSHDDRDLEFRDVVATRCGWLVAVPKHNSDRLFPVIIDGAVTGGDGIRVNSGNDSGIHPTLLDIRNVTVAGLRYSFADDVPGDSLITDHDLGEELRPVTYTGDTTGMTWSTDWNCWVAPL